MKQEVKAQEASFKYAVIHAMHSWRGMFVFGLILGILLGGYQLFNSVQSWDSEVTNYEKQLNEYNESLNDYEKQKEQLQLVIDEQMDLAQAQSDYLQNSVLMNMDVNNKMQASADVLIKLDEAVQDKLGNASYDPADSLIAIYSNRIITETDWESISQVNNIDVKYIKELVNVEFQLDNNIISIEVSHPDEVVAGNILDEVLASVNTQIPDIQYEVFGHTVTIMRGKPEKIPDSDLKRMQEEAKNLLANYNNNITNSKNNLKNLTEPTLVSAPSKMKMGIKVILSAVIGFIVGVFTVGALKVICYFTSDKIYSEAEISESDSICILGSIAVKKEKHFLPAIDRFIDSLAGIDTSLTQKQREDILLYNVKNVLNGKDKLLLVGSVPVESMDKLKEFLNSNIKELKVTVEKDIWKNVDAYDAVNQNDVIILVEKIQSSKYQDILTTKRFIVQNNKEISGCILI